MNREHASQTAMLPAMRQRDWEQDFPGTAQNERRFYTNILDSKYRLTALQRFGVLVLGLSTVLISSYFFVSLSAAARKQGRTGFYWIFFALLMIPSFVLGLLLLKLVALAKRSNVHRHKPTDHQHSTDF
jgi:hypothetical protein